MGRIASGQNVRRAVVRWAAALSCGVLAGKSLTAGTIGWWGFEGKPGEQVGIGTVFSNRVDDTRLSAEVYARYEGTASSDFQPRFVRSVVNQPSAFCSFVGDSSTSVTSRTSLKFTNSPADEGRTQGCPVRIQDKDAQLDLQTFSLEGWFKEDQGSTGWRALFSKGYGSINGKFAYTFALYSYGGGFGAYFCAKKSEGEVVSHESVDLRGPDIRDGRWHYVSLVVNGAKHIAHLFVDFDSNGTPQWIGQFDLGGELAYNADEPLVLGGVNLSNWQFCGEMDEVRLSDSIVNTAEAALNIKDSPTLADGTVVGHFHFEDDFRSSVWDEFWPNATVSAAAGGSAPSFVESGRRMCICDAQGKRTDKTVDAKFLNLSKSKVEWSDPAMLKACADSMTVEFFVKANAAENSDWAGIARAGVDAGRHLLWNLSCHKLSTGDLTCRFDTDSYTSDARNLVDIAAPLDGEWHHVAMTTANVWENNARKVSYAVWIDYECKAKGLIDGWTKYADVEQMGFGLASTPFVGQVNELRLTKGVLPVEKFMRLRKCRGLAIFFGSAMK